MVIVTLMLKSLIVCLYHHAFEFPLPNHVHNNVFIFRVKSQEIGKDGYKLVEY
jgi:hypothetical protein